MASRKFILDPGSTHGGDYDTALLQVKRTADVGADAIKFQLFPPASKDDPKAKGNIPMPFEWFPRLVTAGRNLGVEVFASVWSVSAINLLADCGCTSVKFAYSQRHNDHLQQAADGLFKNIYISGDVMTGWPSIAHIRLYCIPQYPVPYLVDFAGLFPARFQGFSDHTLGVHQTQYAMDKGAMIIEKHAMLESCKVSCPDSRFAVTFDEMRKIIENDRAYEHAVGLC